MFRRREEKLFHYRLSLQTRLQVKRRLNVVGVNEEPLSIPVAFECAHIVGQVEYSARIADAEVTIPQKHVEGLNLLSISFRSIEFKVRTVDPLSSEDDIDQKCGRE